MGRHPHDVLASAEVNNRLDLRDALTVLHIGLCIPLLQQKLVWSLVNCVVSSHNLFIFI